ncbi:hypothetical protein PGQ11_005438 [Apiospora arundinis]|uniref:RRM Nup35-type domain-containing protein n=1 Tax=Apiospora arundinis TaxID=335852 RepID=A0ABR2JAT9_9PEZI
MTDDFNNDAASASAAIDEQSLGAPLSLHQMIWGPRINPPPGFGGAAAFANAGHRRVDQILNPQVAPRPADDVFQPIGIDRSRLLAAGNPQSLTADNLQHLSASITSAHNEPADLLRPEAPSWQPRPTRQPRPQATGWQTPTQAGSSIAPQPQPTNENAAYPPRRFGLQFNRHQQQGFPEDNPPVDPNFKFAETYAGNRAAYANYSAAIPSDLNCSVFLRGLPPKVKHHHILSLIRGCGSRIWALHINKPDVKNPNHSAAKLVFYKRCGVDWLFEKIRSGQFIIEGYEPNAVLNKIKSAPMPDDDPRSRVVCISGPSSIVNVDYMDKFFKENFYFEPDRVVTLFEGPDFRVLEFRFGSARCQGENAIQALQKRMAQVPQTRMAQAQSVAG